jgi:hypothetical protein
LRVGEERKDELLFSQILSPGEVDEEWTKTLSIEATAVFDGKGYKDVEPKSLQIASS